ncbi:MAG TPA: peptidase C39 family protein [Lapillicoccus sp.]|nr:peptidase C39 family protein [Lapillicoccus sp.]
MRNVTFRAWRGEQLELGTQTGTVVTGGSLVVDDGTVSQSRSYTDVKTGTTATYDTATWTSPVVDPGHAFTELVASWNATTPDGTWVEVRVRAVADDGTASWYVLGRWASDDTADGGAVNRTSLNGQATAYATVYTDTLAALNDHTLRTWQLEVTLLRPTGMKTVTPSVRLVGAMASGLPGDKKVPASALGAASAGAIDLAVPTYSQELHKGHYPEYDNGGEAWCSPTSTAMVVGFWGTGPSAADTAWVTPPQDAVVDHAARNVYDYTYDGCGNWPFNTAYAAQYGLEGFVTRLRSLAEAEQFIAAGIPLIASVSFKKGELKGAGYGTNGHLLVIRGFTATGDVVVNDPASHLIPDDAQVRVVYNREEFENVWVPHSGGIVYVIHPAGVALPQAPAQANW